MPPASRPTSLSGTSRLGESITFRFRASDPGIYMYHCGTKPVLAHIANGMYGAIIVQPKAALPPVDNEYVLVGSEWYLTSDGVSEPASLDMGKARSRMPDWVTFNGYANQYVTHPLTADPGETTRFWVVAAGPTNNVNFHVVGAMLDRAWINSDVTQFQRNVQTAIVPAGGGAFFDVKVDAEGLYPFVSHAFADVDLGQVGLLKVGNPKGHVDPLGALRSFPARIGICPDGSRYTDREPSGKRTRRRQMTTILERHTSVETPTEATATTMRAAVVHDFDRRPLQLEKVAEAGCGAG